MDCTKCNSYTEVIDSRTLSDGHIRRRRRCLLCGHRFSSVEIPAEEYKQLSNRRHKCEGCEYRGEHVEKGYKPFGICKKESTLWEAEKSYNAIECPHGVEFME